MKTIGSLLAIFCICSASSLPVVDLGYELHRAISFNNTQGLYNFSNIRYAAPPVGDLRFRAPVWPEENRTHIQDGSRGRVCPQATPLWEQYIELPFVESVLNGSKFNQSTNISSYPYIPGKQDPRTTEDCLFLDVVVPRKIFHRGQNNTLNKGLAPVLVWIYGGGTVVGDGIVFVAINYRLGAFGWLGGDSITTNGTANAALHDQRFALDWVYKNIHLFGGDPKRVTVMGESAGGGSIMHQVTAYGGNKGPSPFQQAIIQSPGWVPVVSEAQQEKTLQQFLGILNVSTIEEARQLSSAKLIAANAYQVATKAQFGDFVYGPVVDGTFVPALPGQLLLQGNFDRNLKIMVGHNADEGLLFTSPDSRKKSGLVTILKNEYPSMKPNVTDYITNVLYPAVYNGTYGYKNPVERTAFVISEAIFELCPPAIHGQDVIYTFYSSNGEPSGLSQAGLEVTNVTIAHAMQDYFTSFVQSGTPSSPVGPVFSPT
ncbi:hypothetical protein N7468_009733 [Penicillium chermesinum]|uniref:Carboxylic ester hydrolase n=1 Tax=Penicillium chermesinum TaxID=63820 RepID=A0A9W9NIE7_9EURO|nr:uncharacterized protein N7468_009733 [Penicillium chermesinum]KAJ5220529.1 hypothetical protein N7468_009733 [Penicillium chermesinum]